MSNSRTKNSILIMITSGIRQILTLLLTFVSRTVFIRTLGADYLGLNGLFSNILTILALSELGIGSAISFYLYKPLAEKNIKRIQALMHFYKICYRIVGICILGIGCCIMPLLPKIVNFDQGIPINLYLVYFLYLLNTASSYLVFAYKQALVTANQEQYKIERINIAFVFINCVADVIVLITFKNYIVYLVVKFLLVLVKNIIIAIIIDKEYPYLKNNKDERISREEIKEFFKDILSVSLFRVGSTLFNATDNIIISMILGTIIVGYYSNYYMIISQVTLIIGILIKSLTAGVGNVIAKETKDRQYGIFKQLNFGVYVISVVCTTCLFQLINSFVRLWIGGYDEKYILSQVVVLFLCISFYFDSTTQVMNTFRECSGYFKTGRFLQIIGGIANIVLSVLLGRRFGLEGIFVATIICKGLITVSPFVIGIGNSVFDNKGWTLLKDYYLKMLLMILILFVIWKLGAPFHMKGLGDFLVEMIFAAIVPVILLTIFFRKNSEFKSLMIRLKGVLRR